MASQHGMFTVHGLNLANLDAQSRSLPTKGSRFLRKLEISREAALYGAIHTSNMLPLDKYSLFRDMDSLGSNINERFLY